jgi:ABC-2 type transport system permease protein
MLVPFLLIVFLLGVALGIRTSAVVHLLGPAAEWFVWPVPAVVSLFAGVFYPIATLPAWMQFGGKLLPVSYVFEGLRTIIAGGPVPGTSLRKGIQRVRTNFCTVQADRPILLKWSIDATHFQAIISDSSR